MLRFISHGLKLFILAVAALSLAASAAAQETTKKETVATGAPKVTKQQM